MTITRRGLIETSGDNSRGTITINETYGFTVSTKAEATVYQVGSQSPYVIGQIHPEDPRCYCSSVRPVMRKLFADWAVEITFTSEREMSENPLFEKAEIEWDGENYEEKLIVDKDGEAVLNSAGDPFVDAMRERNRRVVTILQNVANVPTWILNAEDAVNSVDFTLDGFLIPAGKGKLSAPKLGKWQTRNNNRFREMRLEIKLSKDNWKYKPLDAGFRFRNGASELVRLTSDDGTDITEPACLNGTGQVLTNPTPATAVFLAFDNYPEFDFAALEIRQ
jgi:hypothetical protein